MARWLALLVLFKVASAQAPGDLLLIDRLNELVALRFRTPVPGQLGMSRITTPSSMGKQFHAKRANDRDFSPENAMERELIAKLEENRVEVGLYLFGTAVVRSTPELSDYRALKGPAAITRVTIRNTLPDWKVMYPVARRAMARLQGGGGGFESALAGWDIAVRPIAVEQRCATCHDIRRPIGGVIYAFRRAGLSSGN
jgi:hypothetical protein